MSINGVMMKNAKGFTLIEMMLVMVIVSIIIYASITYLQQRTEQSRIDRAALQTQQILNAGLAYYVANGKWPADINALLTNYLPPTAPVNPWNQPYKLTQKAGTGTPAPPPMLYVWSQVRGASGNGYAAATATAILGNLPLGYTSRDNGTPPNTTSACGTGDNACNVVGLVNIPGQNLNNATAVNFAGLYKHGGCVPVPQCPVDVTGAPMQPSIIVVPVSVSGVNDPSPNSSNIYPISSFTAYATDPRNISGGQPDPCTNGTAVACNPTVTGPSAYWRVCLQIVTEKGDVSVTRASDSTANAWGQQVTLAAFTRCEIKNEPSGSNFSVYSR